MKGVLKIYNMKNQTIILRMTNNCNLNCTYCYDKPNDKNTGKKFKNYINDVVNYIKILNRYKNITQKIILHGGEPLTVPLSTYDLFLNKLKNEVPNCKLSIQTNGTLITKEHLELFLKYNITVGISLDGYNEEQNSCRIYKNGKSTFNRVMESIHLLQKYNIKFGVIITLSKKHIGKEIELYNFIKKNKLQCSIRPAFPVKNSDNKLILSSDEYFEFFKNFFNLWYEDNSEEVGLNQITDVSEELFKVLEPNYRVNICSDCKNCFKNFICLDQEGNLYPCNRNYGIPEFFYGNINQISLEDLYKKIDLLNNERIKFLNNSKCKQCSIYEYCYGGCPSSAYNIYNTYLAPEDYFCDAKIKIRNYIMNKLQDNGDLLYYLQNSKQTNNKDIN